MPIVEHPTDVNKIQETLRNRGHYRGKIDGVFGLRTRASIREFQKAENLPVTGHLDAQTAGKLGVTPEERGEAGYETPAGKPSAGIKWTGRPSKPRRNAVKKIASPGDRAEREKHFKLRTTTARNSLSSFQWRSKANKASRQLYFKPSSPLYCWVIP